MVMVTVMVNGKWQIAMLNEVEKVMAKEMKLVNGNDNW